MKLKSMTEFVLKEQNWKGSYEREKAFERILKYAKFLKQPLTLGMFVPVDETGTVLGFPSTDQYGYYNANHPEEQSGWMYEEGENKYHEALEKWNKAKEKVMFEGFRVSPKNNVKNDTLKLAIYLDTLQHITDYGNGLGGGDLFGNTIEALAYADLGIELTPSALKQIGL